MRAVVVVFACCVAAAGGRAQAAQAAAWRSLGTFDGASVAIKEGKGPTRVKAARVLPIACEPVLAVLDDVPAFSRWIDFTGWDVVVDERSSGGPLRMHGRHAMPFPFSPRDYVVDYRAVRSDGGVFTLTARSTDRGPPAANGTVRLRVESTWTVKPNVDAAAAASPKCPVTYEYDGDLGGSFPPFLLEGAFKDEGPKLLAGLLKAARARPAITTGVVP